MLDACETEGAARPRSTHRAASPPRARRIQRSRRRGAQLPDGAIKVGWGTRWANPFAGRQWGHAKSVNLHRRWLNGQLGALSLERLSFSAGEVAALDRRRIWLLTHLHELAGHDLACHCPLSSRWCHADIYLELAPAYADYESFAL